MRGAFYVDGFNLYHAIDDLNKPYLKWVCLRSLAGVVSRGISKPIERLVFCSAYFPGDTGKRSRHENYVQALENTGVEVRLGHPTHEPIECRNCEREWFQPREKETDINLALAIYEDAVADLYDVAFIVTADTDQVATYKRIKLNFPEKRVIGVIPPGRRTPSHIQNVCGKGNVIRLTEAHIDESVFPRLVPANKGRAVLRPPEYDPPAGWVPFKNRR